jgi:hypothetical protein
MTRFFLAALALAVLPGIAWAQKPAPAAAPAPSPLAYLGYMNFAGVTARLNDAPDGGTITADVDQKILMAAVPRLQSIQVLSPDYPAAFFTGQPVTTDERIAELSDIMLMQGYFADKTHKALRIEEFVSAPDAQGAPRQRHFFTLQIGRKAFETIDVDHLKLGDLTKLTGAQFDPWATQAMAAEAPQR